MATVAIITVAKAAANIELFLASLLIYAQVDCVFISTISGISQLDNMLVAKISIKNIECFSQYSFETLGYILLASYYCAYKFVL